MENFNEGLIDLLAKALPNDVVDKLQELSKADFDNVLANVAEKKKAEFSCTVCEKKFTSKGNLTRHAKVHNGDCYRCLDCNYTTQRKDNMKRHTRAKGHTSYEKGPVENGASSDPCSPPPAKRAKRSTVANDQVEQDLPQPPQPASSTVRTTRSAINGNVEAIEIRPETEDQRYDLLHFIQENREKIQSILEEKSTDQNIKFFFTVQVKMIKYAPDGTYEETNPYFKSKAKTILQTRENLEHDLNESFQKIFASMEEFLKNGSGYQLEEVLRFEITVVKYKPLAASSYIELPLSLKRSNCMVNVANHDNMCFMWSVLSCLYAMEEDPEKVEKYFPFTNALDFSNLDFPTPLSQIGKFERQNIDVSINVFGYEAGEIFPLYITKKTFCDHHVNLLYQRDEEKSHYVWIKKFNRFLSRTKKHHAEHFFCYRCLQGFTDSRKLQNHMDECRMFDSQKITMPKEGEVLEFKEIAKTVRHPFVIYADFECFTRKMDTCEQDPDTCSTNKYQKMEAYSYGYQRVSIDDRYAKPPVIYRGSNVIEHFIESLLKEEEEIMEIMGRIEPMKVTEFDRMEFELATTCHVCKKPFSEKNPKVMDHDHVLGDVRNILHQSCNLQMRQFKYIPCVIHNLKGFDANLIMTKIGKFKDRDIKVIPHNKEKYLSFSLGKLRFIDSLQFLDDSLATLTNNLAQEGGEKHFHYLRKSFPNPDQFSMLLRKGVFPYDYVDQESKLEETSLPPKKDFYSRLTGEDISDEDHAFACSVWGTMKVRTLGEYSDIYLKMDVVLLADVFERFRDICLEDYQLDPCHYFTVPGFSWSAMMKKTGVVLDLITDVDMLLFLEKGLRGGVSSIFHRYAKANNPYLENYNPFEKTSYLGYWDSNNLYGWSMVQRLPESNFIWLDGEETEKVTRDIGELSPDDPEGYIFEVDLEYPHSLHDSHSDFPLAPERMTVDTEDLSPYSRRMLEKLYGKKKLGKCEKLIPNLYDKEKYVLHYRNLQLYLDLGLKLKKTHRVLKFRQSAWLKPYIEFNTEKRKHAKNDFEKSLYKLLNNSIFGRSLMNTRKHVDVKLCHTEKKLHKYTGKPSFKNCQIFTEDLVGVENTRTNILMNQPIYVGFTILDLSKLLMYDFHYNHVKALYGDRVKVCFSDTDSFLYHIETEDVYEDMNEHLHLFDTSDFPKYHFLRSEHNKKVLGKFKDETNGVPIAEFVGLRSKMYSFSHEGGEKHTAKGITKAASKWLRHEAYKECLFKNTVTLSRMNTIRGENHQIFAQTITKRALVPFDDKRYVLEDGVSTKAYGHKDIIHLEW